MGFYLEYKYNTIFNFLTCMYISYCFFVFKFKKKKDSLKEVRE